MQYFEHSEGGLHTVSYVVSGGGSDVRTGEFDKLHPKVRKPAFRTREKVKGDELFYGIYHHSLNLLPIHTARQC